MQELLDGQQHLPSREGLETDSDDDIDDDMDVDIRPPKSSKGMRRCLAIFPDWVVTVNLC